MADRGSQTVGGWPTGYVECLDACGWPLWSQRFNSPIGVAVNASDGSCWIVDRGCYDENTGRYTGSALLHLVVGVPAPVADFCACPFPTSGQAPFTVTFMNASRNVVTADWAWDFGDGATSDEEAPTHTYTAAGSYTVSLTVSNVGGTDTKVAPGFVSVTSPLKYAHFTWGQPFAKANSRLFKRGSTIPIKFTITNLAGAPAKGAVATLAVYACADGAPAGDALAIDSPADSGNQFRSVADGQYLFNLSTKGAAWAGASSFLAQVTLDDGQEFTQEFFLK